MSKSQMSKFNPPVGGQKIKGFTLVELIVYFAVVSFVLLAISVFYYNILLGKNKFSVKSEVSYNANFIANNLSYYIHQAKNIQSLTPTTLTLQIPGSSNVTFNFDATNQKLTFQQGLGPVFDLNTNKVTVTGDFNNLSHYQRSKNILLNLNISSKNPTNSPYWQAEFKTRISFELRAK